MDDPVTQPNTRTKPETLQVLRRSLAETLDIKQQISSAHWNFSQPQFYAFHHSFEDMLNGLNHTQMNLAQRIAQLGGQVEENWKMIANQSRLMDCPNNLKTDQEHYEHYITAFAKLTEELRKGIQISQKNGDLISAHILVQAAKQCEKNLGVMESALKKTKVDTKPNSMAC